MENTEKALETAKQALKEHADNAEELQKATDALIQASHKVAEILYKEQAAQAGAGAEHGQEDAEEKKDEEPIDAEIS